MSEQRSEEHAKLRHRRITGSRVATIMNGGSKAWNTLSEKLWSDEPETFYTVAEYPGMAPQMKRGHIYEPKARGLFWENHPEYEIDLPVFVSPDMCEQDLGLLNEWIGVSPDFMLKSNTGSKWIAGGEVKVPGDEELWRKETALHIVPDKHQPQVCLSLLTTGVEVWYYMIYSPELGKMVEIPVYRDDDNVQTYLEVMKLKIGEFLEVHMEHGTFKVKSASLKQLEDL